MNESMSIRINDRMNYVILRLSANPTYTEPYEVSKTKYDQLVYTHLIGRLSNKGCCYSGSICIRRCDTGPTNTMLEVSSSLSRDITRLMCSIALDSLHLYMYWPI